MKETAIVFFGKTKITVVPLLFVKFQNENQMADFLRHLKYLTFYETPCICMVRKTLKRSFQRY